MLEWSTVFAGLAVLVSIIALIFTAFAAHAAARQAKAAQAQTEVQRDQVKAAREQTRLQHKIARDAAQPYVWADIQPDNRQGSMLHLVVGNSGHTVAQNVKVTFDAPLPSSKDQFERVRQVEGVLAEGLRSLAPGRTIYWPLGVAWEILTEDASLQRTVKVEGDGPSGRLPVLEMVIDPVQWRESADAPEGSLHHVRREIQKLVVEAKGQRKATERLADEWEQPIDQATNRVRNDGRHPRRVAARGLRTRRRQLPK